MAEIEFKLIIVPESYDYGEEEICYRIYFEDQLISERSLPVLQQNQGIVDIFYVKNEGFEPKSLKFINLKNKECKIKSMNINNIKFNSFNGITIKNLNLTVTESKINNTEEISNGLSD
jgi:hypothetical protein